MKSEYTFKLASLLLDHNAKVRTGTVTMQVLELINDSRLTWPDETRLVLVVRSDDLELPGTVAIGRAKPNETVQVEIPFKVLPSAKHDKMPLLPMSGALKN